MYMDEPAPLVSQLVMFTRWFGRTTGSLIGNVGWSPAQISEHSGTRVFQREQTGKILLRERLVWGLA